MSTEVNIAKKLYSDATEANNILKFLLTTNKFPEFQHLNYAKIKCVFKDKLNGYSWSKLGKIVKTKDLYWVLLELDIIVIINEKIWNTLENKEKITLVSYLLSRIKVYWKYEGKKRKSLKTPMNKEVASYNVTYEGRIDYYITPSDVEDLEKISSKLPESYAKLKEIVQKLEE